MKDRIRLIMENEQLSPSAFADKLDLGRAVISHLLNGRNNPSLDVVTRILSKFGNINSEWLLTGIGSMYKERDVGSDLPSSSSVLGNFQQPEPDLFSQVNVFTPSNRVENEYRKENVVNQPKVSMDIPLNQHVIYQKAPEKKISKIIIYYTDNTFETFDGAK